MPEITDDTKRGRVLNLINGIAGLKDSGLEPCGVMTIEGLTVSEMKILKEHLGTRDYAISSQILDFENGSIIFQMRSKKQTLLVP